MEQKDISYLLFGAILFLGWQVYTLNGEVNTLRENSWAPHAVRETIETCTVSEGAIDCKSERFRNAWYLGGQVD